MKNYYCRISISSMEYVVKPSLNTMQQAVSNISFGLNQIFIFIRSTGEMHDDVSSVLQGYYFSSILLDIAEVT